jgi:uroporphyrin-III C-methyltransferase/precorrin-2 dehydrogenase/sirohydrochlorin ferrochelatase
MMNDTREPTEVKPSRIRPLARLPVFLSLVGKRALVAGGTPAAAWKAELLAAAGATVDVCAEHPCDELVQLIGSPARRITLHRRNWTTEDLQGAAIAAGAFDGDEDAQVFAAAARAAGAPVNVVDRPAFCDFSFGAIVNRSPLVIGISTDGASPMLAQAIRAKIEAFIPQGFARWTAAAARWRPALLRTGFSFAMRRRFWQLFTARAVANPEYAPSQSDFDRLIAATKAPGRAAEAGSVTLVGAGPGDPGLLTLRAVRALQSADVILFDHLVAVEILDFARREAKTMLVGKSAHGPSCKQEDINHLMVGLARSGKRVVRLKGGDPMIFGRADEETAACRAAGIAVEVVPGITAAQGAAAALALPLTRRGQARRVQYITGHGEDGALPAGIDWESLADPATTTAVYMPGRTLATLVEKAMAHGLDGDTPALAVASATRPDQAVIAADIGELPECLASTGLRGPLLVIIGRTMPKRLAAKKNGENASWSAYEAADAPCCN